MNGLDMMMASLIRASGIDVQALTGDFLEKTAQLVAAMEAYNRRLASIDKRLQRIEEKLDIKDDEGNLIEYGELHS